MRKAIAQVVGERGHLQRNDDLPGGRELDGIAAEVDEDLLQPQGIANQLRWNRRVNVVQHFNGLVANAGRQHHGQFAQEAIDVKGVNVKFHLARVDFGQVQNVVQQAQQ